MKMYLEKINSPADVKRLTVDEMTALAGGKLALLFVDGSEEAILSNVKLFLLCNDTIIFPNSRISPLRCLIPQVFLFLL